MTIAPIITSRQNSVVKMARGLARGRNVCAAAEMCVEGVRLIEDALTEGIRFHTVLVSPRLEATERGAALRENLLRSANPVVDATDDVLTSISDAAGDQGVVGIAYKKTWKKNHLFPTDRTPLVVVAWGVQDPGNLGTIMRTADAFGATGLITTSASVCPYNTKCIRGTMGAIFRLPVIEVNEDRRAIEMMRSHDVYIIGTSLTESVLHVDVNFNRPIGLIMGGEGGGVPEDVLNLCDRRIRIPIRRDVESLNVASAAAVLLYEAARQRDFAGLV